MHLYVTIHVFSYYAISAAVLIFRLDNDEQHILTFGAFLTRNYINALVKHSIVYYYISTYNNTLNYITMCASAAVIIITSFTIPLPTLLCVLVQQYFLQVHLQYI